MAARPPRPPLDDRQLANLATCGPVLQEVLQGLRPGPEALAFREDFLALPVLGDPLATATFLAAADLYRLGRAKGLSIRSSVDCLSRQLGEALSGAGLRCRPRNFRQKIPPCSKPGRSRDQRERRPEIGRPRRIAAIALEHRVPVWHRGRDFAALARFTALELYAPP